ncbi:4200_t:CDS:1, partial [Scutellospora calospora]
MYQTTNTPHQNTITDNIEVILQAVCDLLLAFNLVIEFSDI